jgi:hypothetical protein
MINYGYFRHRFDASNDPKLQGLIDEMGIIALGYYYSLLEIYGHHYSQNQDKTEVQIHRRVIANTWRKRVDSCDLVLTKLALSGLLVYTKCENTYLIDIPKFLKYYGSYKKTDGQKTPNKRKEKKRKENIIENTEKNCSAYDVLTELSEWADFFCKISTATQKTFLQKYQAEYIEQCVEDATIWLEDNPKKKIGAFFSGWLKRGYEEWLRKNNRLPLEAEKKLIIPKMTDEEFPWPDLLD